MNLKEFFGFCSHKWEIKDKGTIVNENKSKIGTWLLSQCTKCGKVKQKNFRV